MNSDFDDSPLIDPAWDLVNEIEELLAEFSYEEKQLLLDSEDLPSCIYEALVRESDEHPKAA